LETRVREVLAGVLYQITLPLPFELEQVNVHAIRVAQRDWMLVDTGFGDQRSFELLEASLQELSIAWTDIRSLLFTHLHPDHVGLAGRIAQVAKPRLLMHGAEADLLNEMASAGRPLWFEPMHVLAGTPSERILAVDVEFAPMRKTLRRVDPDVRLHGGETIDTACGPLELIWTPGHSPGHICLYSRDHKLLLSGDTIIEDITPNIAWLPGQDTLGDFLGSLQRLAAYEVDSILPSHGAPFTGHREWITATTNHHEDRCRQILRAMENGHHTADELVKSVWNRKFSNFHYHFAASEVLSHLVYLERQGRAWHRAAQNGALEWSNNKC
jgi:glyoxylase-like metal-dependent hydrolase (beta-lactamase superfamily II)